MTDTPARLIAAAALAVSCLSLAWQVYTWRRSTGRIKVSLEKKTQHLWGGASDLADVSVRNVGRGPVYVVVISFVLTSSVPVQWSPVSGAPVLPCALAAGEGKIWTFQLLHNGPPEVESITLPLRAIVRLGDGRTRWSSTDPPVFTFIRASE